jgi:hypothetical protein
MENVMANPQVESREQFYRWIDNHDFPIDDNGNIVAFKGVRKDGKGGYTSISSGTAFVNGVENNGYIPNALGDIVTMPRSEVEFNPRVACHKGLHAGTWKYAKDFSQGAVMHVRINPRDVVSVPNDSSSQKVRVCRYEVISFAEDNYSKARWVDEAAEATVEEAKVPVAELKKAEPVPVTTANAKVGTKVVATNRATYRRSSQGRLLKEGRVYTIGFVDTRDAWVYLNELGHNGGVWMAELDLAPTELANGGLVKGSKVSRGTRDTRENHKYQARDSKGHFIKKV